MHFWTSFLARREAVLQGTSPESRASWSGSLKHLGGLTAQLALVGAVSLSVMGCGEQPPVEAPAGTELVLLPEDAPSVHAGDVFQFRAVVQDPASGQLYNNVRVVVQSTYSDVILVPQTAILAQSDDEDTTWQVSGENYYELTQVDDQIDPTYLETTTDSYGGANVFVYFRCIPVKCDDGYYSSCTMNNSADPSTCEVQPFSLIFQTKVDAASLEFTGD